jgi:hypothetical protein
LIDQHLQLQRKTPGTDAAAFGALRRGRPAPEPPAKSLAGNPGEHGRNYATRVNFFMNKFRKLGFIEYNGRIKVNKSLLTVVLHE